MSKKIYLVSPKGDIVEGSREQRDAAAAGKPLALKSGWRLASQADLDAVDAARKKPAAAKSEPAPSAK